MKKRISLITFLVFLLQIAFQFIGVFPSVQARYTQDDNNGFFLLEFAQNQFGIQTGSSITINTTAGTATMSSGSLSASVTTVQILPPSFSAWKTIQLTTTKPSNTTITVDILDCSGNTITGYAALPYNSAGIDISSLNPTLYQCIQVKTNLGRLSSSTISPSLSKIKVNWSPLPLFLIKSSIDASSPACESTTFNVRFSVNYVDEQNVIVWAQLPMSSNITGSRVYNYSGGYGQFPSLDPIFIDATYDGQYTAIPLTVQGQSIPANSVYWDMGDLVAGTTRNLGVTVDVPCGTQNNTKYSLQPFIDGDRGNLTIAPAVVTTISSLPSPGLMTWMRGAYTTDYKNYLLPDACGSKIVTYNIQNRNAPYPYSNGSATENIFSGYVVEDLSLIFSGLQNTCGVALPSTRILNISTGGFLSGSNIIRYENTQLFGGDGYSFTEKSSITHSYQIDYAGCTVSGFNFITTTTFDGNNIDPLIKTQKLNVGPTPSGGGIFSKTPDSNVGSYYEDILQYTLNYSNLTTTGLDYLIVTDKISTDHTFISASIPSGYTGYIYYSSTGVGNDPLNPPYFDHTNATLGNAGFNRSASPTNPVTWVAYYVRHLDPGFATSICDTNPSLTGTTFIGTLKVKLNTPSGSYSFGTGTLANSCKDYIYMNTGNYQIIGGATGYDIGSMKGSPIAPKLVFTVSSGSKDLEALQDGTYTVTVQNEGKDTLFSGKVVLYIPTIKYDGVSTNLDINTVIGGVVDYLQSGKVIVDIGTLPIGASKTITFKTSIKRGVLEGDSYVINVRAEGYDNPCGPVATTTSLATKVHGGPELLLNKTRDKSFIGQLNTILYSLTFSNQGYGVSTNSWIVDIIPRTVSFQRAYTNITSGGQTYNCIGCTVYFAPDTAALPSALSPTDPMDPNLIAANFIIGTEVSLGQRTSPFGTNTRYVAYKIDNRNLAPAIYRTNTINKVGFVVNDVSTPLGGLIVNNAAILSDELVQALANQVQTTLLGQPGLFVDIFSSKEVLTACEPFDYTVDYVNDAVGSITTGSLTVLLPYGVELLTGSTGIILHKRNAVAITSGASVTTGDLSVSPYMTKTVNSSGETQLNFPYTQYRGAVLGAGQGGRLTFKAKTSCSDPSGMMPVATAIGTFANPIADGFVDDTDQIIVQNADLYLRKTADNITPLPGEYVNYIITVSNEGQHDASGVVLMDTLPPGLCYVTNSTTILTPNWILGQPVVAGSCAFGQTLIRSIANNNAIRTILLNPLTTTAYATGTIPGQSEDVRITYRALVQSNAIDGTTLSNGATVSTTTTEDLLYVNSSSQLVQVPYPDPYTTISATNNTLPGEDMDITINYADDSRTCIKSGAVIYTIPDYDADGISDIIINSLLTYDGESIFYHPCPTSSLTPFDYMNPTSGLWTTTRPSQNTPNSMICQIAIKTNHDICFDAGIQKVSITAQAKDELSNLVPGTTLTHQVTIIGNNGDTNLTNNSTSALTRIPSVDLSLDIVGSTEGNYPGLTPGDSLTYTLNFSNLGNVAACQDYVDVAFDPSLLSSQAVPLNPTLLILTDHQGNDVSPLDSLGNPLGAVSLTYTLLSSGVVRIGFGGVNGSSSVCLPGGSQGSFNLLMKVKTTVSDSSQIYATGTIVKLSAGAEDTLTNNIDTTSTIVYRPDLTINKTATVDLDNNSVFTTGTTDSTIAAYQNRTIRYKLEYDNIGNATANNAYVTEKIPAGSCLRVAGSPLAGVFTNLAPGTIVEYSADNGATRGYRLVNMLGMDCNVTHVRWKLGDVPAPANYYTEQDRGQRQSSGMIDLVPITKGRLPQWMDNTPFLKGYGQEGYNQLLKGIGSRSFYGGTNNLIPVNPTYMQRSYGLSLTPFGYGNKQFDLGFTRISAGDVGDFNNDGKIDFVVNDTATNGQNLYLNTTINSSIPSFTKIILYSGYLGAYVMAADMNRDSKIDFVAIGNPSRLYINTSIGSTVTFSSGLVNGFWFNQFGPSLADINNDGLIDFLAPNVTYNTTTGFGGNPTFLVSGSRSSYGIIIPSDFDNDGRVDYFSQSYGGPNQCKRLRNTGSSGGVTVFASSSGGIAGCGGIGAVAGDFNGDSKNDIINFMGGGYLGFYNNITVGSTIDFSYHNLGITPTNQYLSLGDFNGDGKLDVVSFPGQTYSPDGYTRLHTNTIPLNIMIPNFASAKMSQMSGFTNGGLIADFNNDGRTDIIQLGGSGNTLLLLNTYPLTGKYFTIISGSSNLQSWNKLIIDQTLQAGTNLKYSVYPVSSTGSCLTGSTPLIGQMERPVDGYINLGSIDASNKRICVVVDFFADSSLTTNKTPILNGLTTTWTTTERPYFTFDVMTRSQIRQATTGAVQGEYIGDELIPNTATISTTSFEITGSNNTSSYDLNFLPADLVVTKTVSQAAVTVGDTISYTLNYSNNGPQSAQSVFIDDLLPNGFTFVSASLASANLTSGAVIIGKRFTINTLSAGQTGTIIVTGTISGSVAAGDILTNNATIYSTLSYDPNLSNNSSSPSSVVGLYTNLWTTIDVPSMTNINALLSGVVKWGNNGNGIALNSNMIIALDTGVTFVSASCQLAIPACSYSGSIHSIVRPIGTIAPGSGGTINFLTQVKNDLTLLLSGNTLLDFISTVSTSSDETDTADNISIDTTRVVPGLPSSIAGVVYADIDTSQSRTTGDQTVAGSTVYLYGQDIYGTIYGPDPVTDSGAYMAFIASNPVWSSLITINPSIYQTISPVVTSYNGQYSFGALLPGTYSTALSVPMGYSGYTSTGGMLWVQSGSSFIMTSIPTGSGSLNGGSSITDITAITLSENQQSKLNDYGLVTSSINLAVTNIVAMAGPAGLIRLNIIYGNTTASNASGVELSIGLPSGVTPASIQSLLSSTQGLTGYTYNSGTNTITFIIDTFSGYTNHTLSLLLSNTNAIPSTGLTLGFISTINALTQTEITELDNTKSTIFTLSNVTNGLSGVVFFDNNRLTGYQIGSGDYMLSGIRVYLIGQDIYGNVYAPVSGVTNRSGIIIPSLSGNGVYYTGLTMLTSSGTSLLTTGGFLFTGLNQGTYSIMIDSSMFPTIKNFTSSGGILSGTTLIRGTGLIQNTSIPAYIVSGVSLLTGQFVRDIQFALIQNRVDLTTVLSPVLMTGVVAGYDAIPYLLVYANSGSDLETNASITIQLPNGLYPVSYQTGILYNTGGNTLTVSGLMLSGGTTGLLQFTLGVLTGVISGSILPITATITGVMTDINLINNPSVATVMTIAPTANINLNKSADLSIVIVQLDTLQYQLVVCNSGPHLASGIIITDILPSTLQYQSSSIPYSTTYITGGGIAYLYTLTGMLAVNACTGVTMTVAISGGVNSGTALINQASVVSAVRDPDISDNSDIAASTGITVHTIHNFIYFDINFNGTRDVGEPLLPVNLILSGMQASTGGNGSYSINTNQVFANPGGDAQIPNILDGTYTINFDINDPDLINAGFGLTEFVITTSGELNGNLTGNMITVTGGTYTGLMVGVHLANDLQTVISTPTLTAIVGETITYDITYFNTLAGGDPDATLTFTVPAGTILLNTSFSGNLSGNIFTYHIGPMSGYDYGLGTVTLLVTSLMSSGSTLTVPTTIIGSGLDLYPFNNTSLVSTPTIDPQSQVFVHKKADLSIAIVQLDSIDYELVVCNSGPQSASGVKVIDIMPPTLQYQSSSRPYDLVYASGASMVYEYYFTGFLPVNACETIIINAIISGSVMTGNLVINQATVTGANRDPDPNDNNDIATTLAHTVHSVINYVFYDNNYNGILDPGETLLPIDIVLSGATAIVSGNGIYPSSTRTLPFIGGLSLFDNALDGSYDYWLNDTDPDYTALTGPIVVTTFTGVSGTTGGLLTITGGTQTGVIIGLYQPVDLYTTISADHITPVAGYEFVHFNITYGNSGYGYEPNSFITIEIPNTILYHIGDLPVYTMSSSGSSNFYTFSLSGLIAGTGGLFGFTGFVLTGTVTGTIAPLISTITGSALDMWLDNNQDQVDLTIQAPTASLSVTKTGDVSVAIIQLDKVNYTIYACNQGPHNASGVVIVDTVPYDLTVSSMSVTPDSYMAVSSGVEYTFIYPGMLGVGQCTPPILVTIEFTPGQTNNNELVDNTVTVSSDIYDDDLSNNIAIKSVTGLLLRDIPSYIFWDENNNGIYDNIDQYLSINMFIDGLLAMTGTDGTYPTLTRPQQQVPGGFSLATGLLYSSYSMRIDETDPDYINFGPYSITTLMNSNGNLSGRITVDDTTYTGLYIGLYKPRIDLNVWIDVSTGTAKSGDNLTYTITYTNSGIDTASGVMISIPWPAELNLNTVSFPYLLSGGYLTFSIESLDTFTTGMITLDTTILPNAIPGQSIIPLATITGQGFEMDYTYNQSFATTIIRNRESDLSLLKTTNKTQLYPNDIVTYTFSYTNSGNDDAVGTYITDILPSSAVLLSSTVPYSFTGTTGGIIYNFVLGTVPAGTTGVMIITVRYDASFANLIIVNTGIIDSLPYIMDYDRSNNISSTSGMTMVTIPTTIPGGGFAGGGGTPRDTCPLGDRTASYYDGQCDIPSIVSGIVPVISSGIQFHTSGTLITPKPKLILNHIPYEVHEVTTTIANPLKSAVGSLNFGLPKILPQTGTPVKQLREKGVSITKNKNIQTEMADRIVPVSPRIYKTKTDITYRLQRLPKKGGYQNDLQSSTYIVIPRLGIISPINDIPETAKDYKRILYGESIDVNTWLQGGVLRYPLSGLPATIGNMVIAGHSSYFKSDTGRYKTIFTSLPLLNAGDEIWIYQRSNNTGNTYQSIQDRSSSGYNRYVYIVDRSFETDKTDVKILEPQIGSTLTLMTCTPIGTAKNRWIVQGNIVAPETIDVTKSIRVYQVTAEFRAIVLGWKNIILGLETEEQKSKERQRIKNIITKKRGGKPQRQKFMNYTIQELAL